jgi:hypothetical protein
MMKVSISLAAVEQRTLGEVLQLVPWANAHAIARVAVAIGLDVLRGEPERVPALLAGRRVRFSPVAETLSDGSASQDATPTSEAATGTDRP